MNTTPTTDGPIGLDRTHADAVLYRVAICAFTYYPDKPTEEPGYTIEEDVDWCIAPLTGIDQTTLDDLRQGIRNAIADPTAERQGFITHLVTL